MELTLFKMGVPVASFSPVISTNERTNPQNLLTFSFNPFDRLV